jgi:Uma2 family endonuclease
MRRPATYADLEALPDNVVGEIVDGELHVSPRPAILHARAASRLGSRLGAPFDEGMGGPGGWIILDEPELHLLGEQVVVPDLAGWRRERMPKLEDVPYITLAPDWLCEVVSPGTARLDRVKKLPIYARAGVGYLWLVDPAERTLESYRLEAQRWVLLGTFTEGTVRVEPFEALAWDVEALWAR